LKRFLVSLAVFAFVVVASTYALAWFSITPLPTMLWPTVFFTIICTSVMFRRVIQSTREQFMMVYLLTIVLKLLVSLIYAVVIMLLDKPGAVPNVLFFLLLYIVFTILEVIHLFRSQNR
jgi:hypothetical protein